MTTLHLEIADSKAIEILSHFPAHEQAQIAAKYITIGNVVINYAQLTANQQNLQEYFTPITDKLVNSLNTTMTNATHQFALMHKQLEGTLPNNVSQELNKLTTPIAQLQSITDTLNKLNENLVSSIFASAKPQKKGAFSCDAIYQSLQENFKEDYFEDVSGKARFTDILATNHARQAPIYIEIKDYANTVPSTEVQKFWRDLETRQATIGCFISLKTAIANTTSDFCFCNNGKQIGIFIVSEAMGGQGHLWAYKTARRISELITPQALDTNIMEKTEWIISILNARLQEIQSNLQDFEKIQNDLEKSKETIEKNLASIIGKINKLKTKLETTIDISLNDFQSQVSKG